MFKDEKNFYTRRGKFDILLQLRNNRMSFILLPHSSLGVEIIEKEHWIRQQGAVELSKINLENKKRLIKSSLARDVRDDEIESAKKKLKLQSEYYII